MATFYAGKQQPCSDRTSLSSTHTPESGTTIHGNAHDAVEHYIAGGDLDTAADLIYDEATELMNRGNCARSETRSTGSDPLPTATPVRWSCGAGFRCSPGTSPTRRNCLVRVRNLEPNNDEARLIVALAIMANFASGDIGSALTEARSAGEPFESTQAMTLGGAHMWGGDFDPATTLLTQAQSMAAQEGNAFVEAVAPIFRSIADIESGNSDSAHRHASQALETANAHGFSELAQTALAHSIVARTSTASEDAVAAAQRGVALARKSPERIMLAYALSSGGDVLCHYGHPDGEALLRDARVIIDRCPDPGIAGRYLALVEARHQIGATQPRPTVPHLTEGLTDRELAVLRYLPSQLSQRDIASELYVSLNTVKTHCKAIYRKLGVRDRKAAVQTARDLRLL